ncbi:hypothetical protein B0T19DRAFT_430663 [Cercophora scortea]|uniref:Uncharacterized protein n=1 Tax=Cercophora scortea TaxID=314031 RepID=A0AAE0M7J8_9PEZI|nr:hypothetical protein B0T19DRAFT_430663 [Cercophora scortea]
MTSGFFFLKNNCPFNGPLTRYDRSGAATPGCGQHEKEQAAERDPKRKPRSRVHYLRVIKKQNPKPQNPSPRNPPPLECLQGPSSALLEQIRDHPFHKYKHPQAHVHHKNVQVRRNTRPNKNKKTHKPRERSAPADLGPKRHERSPLSQFRSRPTRLAGPRRLNPRGCVTGLANRSQVSNHSVRKAAIINRNFRHSRPLLATNELLNPSPLFFFTVDQHGYRCRRQDAASTHI